MRAESSLQTCGSAEGLVFINEEGPFPSPLSSAGHCPSYYSDQDRGIADTKLGGGEGGGER